VLRDKEVLTNPIGKAGEQIIIKMGSVDFSIKESEGPTIIDNLDQFDVEKISRGSVINDDDGESSTSARKNIQLIWCPLGFSRTQRHKLQCACYKKLKLERASRLFKVS
jgi:hypothetical protein